MHHRPVKWLGILPEMDRSCCKPAEMVQEKSVQKQDCPEPGQKVRMEDYTKLTDENMVEYEEFAKAVRKYAEFLLKKRKLGSKRTIELMVPMTRMIIIDESYVKEE